MYPTLDSSSSAASDVNNLKISAMWTLAEPSTLITNGSRWLNLEIHLDAIDCEVSRPYCRRNRPRPEFICRSGYGFHITSGTVARANIGLVWPVDEIECCIYVMRSCDEAVLSTVRPYIRCLLGFWRCVSYYYCKTSVRKKHT